MRIAAILWPLAPAAPVAALMASVSSDWRTDVLIVPVVWMAMVFVVRARDLIWSILCILAGTGIGLWAAAQRLRSGIWPRTGTFHMLQEYGIDLSHVLDRPDWAGAAWLCRWLADWPLPVFLIGFGLLLAGVIQGVDSDARRHAAPRI